MDLHIIGGRIKVAHLRLFLVVDLPVDLVFHVFAFTALRRWSDEKDLMAYLPVCLIRDGQTTSAAAKNVTAPTATQTPNLVKGGQ